MSLNDGVENIYGCVFCQTGREAFVAQTIEKNMEDVSAIVPRKLRLRHLDGVPVEEEVILFPGYVFICLKGKIPIWETLKRQSNVYALLTDVDGEWVLSGSDREIAKLFFEAGGTIGFSKAYYEGNRIRIIDGFLKGYEGSIDKVNHRAKTARVNVLFREKKITMWLGFELIEKGNGDGLW